MSKFKEVTMSGMRLNEALALPICKGIPERGLTQETCQRFGIREEFSQVHGTVIAHLFPVYKDGNITGFKRRELGISKKKAFSTIGDVSTECTLLGGEKAGAGNWLFITEGVYDYPSLYQALHNLPSNQARDRPYHHNVVSITLGCGESGANAAQSIIANKELLDRYEKVVLVYDNDEAGKEGIQASVMAYPSAKVAYIPLKDSNEHLVKGETKSLIDAVFNPSDYNVDNISYGADSIESLMTPVPKGVFIQGFPELMQKMQGFRPGELTFVLAPPKAGKTTLCKEINYQLLKAKQKTIGIYLEEDLRKTQQSFVAIDNNVHLPYYRQDPSQVPVQEVQRTMDTILSPEYAMFCDDRKGHITPSKLLQLLEWSALKGCKFAILDHISFVFSGMKAVDERKEIDKLLTDIAAFVKKSGMHVIAVAHITRDKNKPKPKNQDGSVKYPYWYEVEETDGRGSGAFEQICWNMIGVDKEIKEDKTRGRTRLRLLYNREWDRTGLCDELTLCHSSGRLKSVQD